MKTILTVSIFLLSNLYGSEFLKNITLYPFGYVKHAKPTPLTNEGSMDYFAISKMFSHEKWNFDTGVGTFVDSYSIRSYKVFTNISYSEYKWGFLTPIVSMEFYSKGEAYGSSNRHQFLYPSFKLRVGEEDGLFMYIQPVPKLGTLTNGFVAVEVGYRF